MKPRKILLFPFAKAMRGGIHHPEQLLRLEETYQLYRFYSFVKGEDVTILCSTGLANSSNISVAETMAQEIIGIGEVFNDPTIFEHDVRIGERVSTHTSENIRFSRDILLEDWDLIICISSPGFLFLPGHTDRIRRLMRNIFPQLENVIVAPSKPYGSIFYRLVRGVTELLLIIELWFDPKALFLDRGSAKRTLEACSLPRII